MIASQDVWGRGYADMWKYLHDLNSVALICVIPLRELRELHQFLVFCCELCDFLKEEEWGSKDRAEGG